MKPLLNWLKESNRYKHLIGGMLIGLWSFGWYCAAFAGIGIASALEFKDRQWGGKWDWIDGNRLPTEDDFQIRMDYVTSEGDGGSITFKVTDIGGGRHE